MPPNPYHTPSPQGQSTAYEQLARACHAKGWWLELNANKDQLTTLAIKTTTGTMIATADINHGNLPDTLNHSAQHCLKQIEHLQTT